MSSGNSDQAFNAPVEGFFLPPRCWPDAIPFHRIVFTTPSVDSDFFADFEIVPYDPVPLPRTVRFKRDCPLGVKQWLDTSGFPFSGEPVDRPCDCPPLNHSTVHPLALVRDDAFYDESLCHVVVSYALVTGGGHPPPFLRDLIQS